MKNISLLIFILLTIEMYGQACCTAGTPLLGSLDMSTVKKGTWQFSLTYEHNLLESVFEGSSEIDDNSRQRVTQSALLEINYGLTERFSITALVSYVNQLRNIDSGTGTANELTTSGIGDILFMAKYSVINLDIIDQRELALGFGVKAPVGAFDLTSNGILLPADLQPGTGSWDLVLWSYFSQGFLPLFPINIIANSSYRLNSTNNRFGGNSGNYKFGNELITTAGIAYATDLPVDFNLLLRFRNTDPDSFNDFEIPNTGGSWLYLVPGINVKFSQNINARISGQIPIYRDLNGTQLSTTRTISAALFYSFGEVSSLINN